MAANSDRLALQAQVAELQQQLAAAQAATQPPDSPATPRAQSDAAAGGAAAAAEAVAFSNPVYSAERETGLAEEVEGLRSQLSAVEKEARQLREEVAGLHALGVQQELALVQATTPRHLTPILGLGAAPSVSAHREGLGWQQQSDEGGWRGLACPCLAPGAAPLHPACLPA